MFDEADEKRPSWLSGWWALVLALGALAAFLIDRLKPFLESIAGEEQEHGAVRNYIGKLGSIPREVTLTALGLFFLAMVIVRTIEHRRQVRLWEALERERESPIARKWRAMQIRHTDLHKGLTMHHGELFFYVASHMDGRPWDAMIAAAAGTAKMDEDDFRNIFLLSDKSLANDMLYARTYIEMADGYALKEPEYSILPEGIEMRDYAAPRVNAIRAQRRRKEARLHRRFLHWYRTRCWS